MFHSSYIPDYQSLKQLHQLKTYNIFDIEKIQNKKKEN